MLGKETIDTNSFGKSSGRNGNYSTNYQISGRELLTPDEVRMLDNKYAILFIRGEYPIMDEKYDILRHPNIALTTDGGAKPFVHGTTERCGMSIFALEDDVDIIPELSLPNYISELELELYSEEEIIEEINNNQ